MKRQNVLNKKKKKKGFTLIELIIVIAIIAILAVIAIPKFGEVKKNANVSADISNAKVISNSINALIAEGTISLPSSTVTYTFTGSISGDTKKIVDYMQSMPTPKYRTTQGYFKATLDKDGNVEVSADGVKACPISKPSEYSDD